MCEKVKSSVTTSQSPREHFEEPNPNKEIMSKILDYLYLGKCLLCFFVQSIIELVLRNNSIEVSLKVRVKTFYSYGLSVHFNYLNVSKL